MATILIADDIAENRYMLAALLEGHGFAVHAVSNGAEALADAQRAVPDLIVSDLLMPVMDGFELCRRWHQDSRLRTVPFVVYTATYTEPKDEQLARDMGADLFLLKPQEPDHLLASVRAFLDRPARGGSGDDGAGAPLAPEADALLLQHNQALVDKLEKKVRALEVEIAERGRLQEELLHARKLEALGRLAASVAHDITNVLSVIMSYAETARVTLHEGDPLLVDLREISDATKRASALTRQLLAFGRKQSLVPRLVDVNQVIVGVEGMLRRLVAEGVALKLRLGEGLAKVRADPAQLEQVLVNLTINASDAMPRGGTLAIATANAGSGGGSIVLTVTDTGTGMDAATRARVFEPFFTTKDPGRGTGLGLAIVHGIVTQSGGQITVDSVAGQGSTFTVTLPAASSP